MNVGTLIDAVVRQTTVLVAQLATTSGGRAQLAHTANQVFLDLVASLKDQGLGSKVIADMFGLALRTYHAKVQRLGESRTIRGRTLWEALYQYLQTEGSTARTQVLQRFSHDDPMSVRGVLKDLVDSGVVYRAGRGENARYQVAEEAELSTTSSPEQAAHLVWMAVHRLQPVSLGSLAETLAMGAEDLEPLLDQLTLDGRIAKGEGSKPSYTSGGCVLPLGDSAGWEAAVFDHYQAVVSALCTKLRMGQLRADQADLVGGSTFSYQIWPGHPHYDEATQFLANFRKNGTELRRKIAAHNSDHEAPDNAQRLLIYGGQTLTGAEEMETDHDE